MIHGILLFLLLYARMKKKKFIGIYNFSEYDKVAWINEEDGIYTDLISGRKMEAKGSSDTCFWMLLALQKK